jgi:hypothetical protein
VFPHLSTNIKQFRSVERFLVILLDDEDFVVNVLLSQVVVQVREKLPELTLSIAVRNYYSCGKAWVAFLGPVLA